jgi:hypothetical protein
MAYITASESKVKLVSKTISGAFRLKALPVSLYRAFATPYFALASQFVRFIRKPLMGNILC